MCLWVKLHDSDKMTDPGTGGSRGADVYLQQTTGMEEHSTKWNG